MRVLKVYIDTSVLGAILDIEDRLYLQEGVVPAKFRDDARHIAVAVINSIDVIVTWNCRHMANIEKKRLINAVNLIKGYPQIDIVTPMEVIS